jgi:hypothetical protein
MSVKKKDKADACGKDKRRTKQTLAAKTFIEYPGTHMKK